MSTDQTAEVHTFKDLEKFGMFTDAPGVQGRRSRLVLGAYRGNPRFTVFTGIPDDLEKGVIRAPMSPEVFLILMQMLKKIVESPPGTKEYMENYTNARVEEGQQRPNPPERIYLSTTWIGKDKEGVVWISVRTKDANRPTIVFKFTISDFHKLFKGNGEAYTEAEASCLQALAWMHGATKAMEQYMGQEKPPYDPDAPRPGRNGNGGGFGGRKPGGGQPNRSRVGEDNLEDIPI